MEILIFAGGTGTRLWPLSRKNTPKQFGKDFNGKSTLQLTFERVEPAFGIENVYISTNERYVSLIKEQLPQVPAVNIVAEPEKRDLAPAVGYNLIRIKKAGCQGPVAIVWADHIMEKPQEFILALKNGERLVKKNPKQIVFLAEKPRYAQNNLGWIHVGEKIRNQLYQFQEWHYRPPLAKCGKMFESGEWYWNPGYFIVDLDLILNLYQKFMPKMFRQLEKIAESIGTTRESAVLSKIYPTLESISFDDAIIEKVGPEQAVVQMVDMGWSDPGTLYALKEALEPSLDENLTRGKVYSLDSKDCLIYNDEKNKLVTVVGLEGYIIINSEDTLLVVNKSDVPRIKELVKKLGKDGFEDYI